MSVPVKECDLVMRGGITSGIVYPRAITRISDEYRFRSVGGASAGAIAAAFAAAAELNRGQDGFQRLNRVPGQFGNGLSGLFQPYPELRRLFEDVFFRLPGRSGLRLLGFLLLRSWRIYRGIKRIAKRDFGMCPGTSQPGRRNPALINWLNGWLEYVAGRAAVPDEDGALPERPLLFSDLSRANIALRLVSTNLSEARPEPLPIRRGFRITRDDARGLLPSNVFSWLAEHHPDEDEPRFLKLGEVDQTTNRVDMPVILAVRMSLSFPILFSAVPLYRKDHSLNEELCPGESEIRRRCLISDGGISSNFPIHLFDAPISSRPTFAINLRPTHPCRNGPDPDSGALWNRIFMPGEAGAGLTYSIAKIGCCDISAVVRFFSAILDTARNWQDSMQMRMPGYRERIVHISLDEKKEGGLNLNMKGEVIDRLSGLGYLAGDRIISGEPNGEPPFDFQFHRWRRLLACTRAVEEMLADICVAYTNQSPGGDPGSGSLQEMLERYRDTFEEDANPYGGYPSSDLITVENMIHRWSSLVEVAKTWDAHRVDGFGDKPRPKPTTRLVDSSLSE